VADGGNPGAIFYSNAAMITTKDPARQEAAGKFLTWLLEPENYGRFLNMEPGLFLPVTEDGAKADSFWKDALTVKYKPQIEQMVKNQEGGALFGFTGGNVFPAIGQISAQNLLAQVVQKVIVDKQKPADAVKWGQEQMTAAAQAAAK
jgi:multiple sugar transport system substrate-binding protein